MYDDTGQQVWSADISVWGKLRNVEGDEHACPFRWPGQYADAETGLYYNRFRYYDPEAGDYVSQDPIGLAGGTSASSYVVDPTVWVDAFGLAGCKTKLGLGLKSQRKGLDYIEWSKKNGFKTYGQLSGGGSFPKQIREAMDAADEVHFNLEGVDVSRASSRLNEYGDPFTGNYTNYELALIRDNVEYRDKTTWYKDGKPLPEGFNPFS